MPPDCCFLSKPEELKNCPDLFGPCASTHLLLLNLLPLLPSIILFLLRPPILLLLHFLRLLNSSGLQFGFCVFLCSHLLQLLLRVEELGDSADQLGAHEEGLTIAGGQRSQVRGKGRQSQREERRPHLTHSPSVQHLPLIPEVAPG